MSYPIDVSGSDLSSIEERLMRKGANLSKKTDSDENEFGSNYKEVEREYYNIYLDTFWNLLVSLIKYDNAPDTLDIATLEWQLRMYGWARVGGDSATNIHVLSTDYNDEKDSPDLGMLGFFSDLANRTLDTDKTVSIPFITPANFQRLAEEQRGGYVTLSNKFSFWYGGLSTNWSDSKLIQRVARTLAKIKATANFNLTQMKAPFIGYTTNKNLTALNIWKQIENGTPFISVDSEIGDVSREIGIIPINNQPYLAELKDEWNNNLNEMLTFLGINSLSQDKKERQNVLETSANSQLIEASGNVYLNARNRNLKLLNNVLGTEITASFNQESYQALVQLASKDPLTGISDPAMLPSDNTQLGAQYTQSMNQGGQANG